MYKSTNIHDEEHVIPLTSGQHGYLNASPVNLHYRNLVSLCSVPPALDPTHLKRALQYLLHYHDALRLRFVQGENGWQQLLLPSDNTIPFVHINLTHLSDEQWETCLEELATEQQASLNLSTGPVCKLVYFDFGLSRPGRLLFILHHMISDALSKTLLLKDFQTAYLQLDRGQAIHLAPKTDSFAAWAKRLDRYAQSVELKEEIDSYWLTLPWDHVISPPIDYPENISSCRMSSNCLLQTSLSAEETLGLLTHSLAARLPLQVTLLAGLALAFADWTGSPLLQVGVGHHSRTLFHDLKLTRTIGLIALVGTLLLDIRGSHTLDDVLHQVEEQIHHVPNYGFGRGLTRLCRDTTVKEKMQTIPTQQVLFNYLGQRKSSSAPSDFLQPASEHIGPNIDPQEFRKNVIRNLYCKVVIIDNQLCVTWEYSKDIHRSTTIEALAQHYMAVLRKLADVLARA